MRFKVSIISACTILMLCSSFAFASSVPLWLTKAVSRQYIPISKRTDSVILYHYISLKYKSGTIYRDEKIAVRILTPNGLKQATILIIYEKGTKVRKIKGWHFNRNHQLIKKLPKENIVRRAYNLNFQDDAQQMIFGFDSVKVGDTVAYEYSRVIKPFFKQFIITMGGDNEIAFKQVRINSQAQVKILQDPKHSIHLNKNSYYIEKQPNIPVEISSLPDIDRIPLLAISFSPEIKTWSDFAAFFYKNTKSFQHLSKGVIDKILPDISRNINEKTVISKVVNFVRTKVKYIDIEVGKGGYIPRSPSFVLEKKYGDCKDMAFLAGEILYQKGIKAFPMLANFRDSGQVHPEFVGKQFKHVILAIELSKPFKSMVTTYYHDKPLCIVDLTNPYIPFPLVGKNLEGTYVLPILPTKSSLLKLPVSDVSLNRVTYEIKAIYNAERILEGTITEVKKGYHAVDEKNFLDHIKKTDERETYVYWCQRLISGAKLKDYAVKREDGSVTTTVKFSVISFGYELNDSYLIPLNLIDNKVKKFQKRHRKSPLDLRPLSSEKVSIHVTFDKNCSIVNLPKDKVEENPFFSYSYSAKLQQNAVIINKEILWKKALISPQEYKKFRILFAKYLRKVKSTVTITVSDK